MERSTFGGKITGMHWNCDSKITSFQAQMAATLANLYKSGFFECANHLTRLENRKIRHMREQLCLL